MKRTDWNPVYHIGGQGDGVAPAECWGLLNDNPSMQRGGGTNRWQDTAPTATHFTVGAEAACNGPSENMMAVLFTSIDGVSKCGYYTGDGTSNSSKVINVGFQPRFLLVKCASDQGSWWVYDSTRGFDLTGDTKPIALNTDAAQLSVRPVTGTRRDQAGRALRRLPLRLQSPGRHLLSGRIASHCHPDPAMGFRAGAYRRAQLRF